MEINAVQLTPALVAGGLMAILLETIPGVKTWWSGRASAQKQILNLVLVLIVSLLFVALPVLVGGGAWPTGWGWVTEPLAVFFVTLAGSQSAHFGTKLVTAPKPVDDA
jgi:hypothetical protein